MIYTCKKCRKEFEAPKWRKAVYCSRSCSGKGQKGEGIVKKPCEQCGETFESLKWKNRRFCSQECSGLNRRTRTVEKCEICDKEVEVKPCHQGSKRYCSRDCAGESKRTREERKCETCQKPFYPVKKTSRFCSTNCKYASYPRKGYREVYAKFLPQEEQELFASMFDKQGRVHEHRLVMARHVSRPLTSTEIVHHKNGIKRDNRIENLELLESKKKHHTGYGDEIYQELEEAKARIKELESQLPK